MPQMEETSVVIVGGGPVGTFLGALLCRNFNIPTIVLEKETSIPQDPRAFSLTQDGIRCLQSVGLYDKVYTKLGESSATVHFITGRHQDINKRPMLTMLGDGPGWTSHTMNVMFAQPIMEECLRDVVEQSSLGQFRDGAEVVGITEDEENVEVTYKDVRTDQTKSIKAKFVVGTDGRRGFVRKHYLEPKGVILEYVNDLAPTFVGMNWDVLVPTPKTHPDFALWAKGYSSEDVVRAFTPEPFKFMCNPDRNCVMSRAGRWTDGSRLWRTEFALMPREDRDIMSRPESLFELIKPYMIHPGKRYGLSHDVAFPFDCLQPRRSWAYKFESRTCNYWWKGRVFLAGDSAHVFPPYGGQGVTQGFLDASSLSWRLATALSSENEGKAPKQLSKLFDGWQEERKTNIIQSLTYTYKMRDLFQEVNPIKLLIREIMMWLMQLIPSMRRKIQTPPFEPPKYEYAPGMAFLPGLDGGRIFFQSYCRGLGDGDPVAFSDDLVFSDTKQPLGLAVLASSVDDACAAQKELSSAKLENILLDQAVYIVDSLDARHSTESTKLNIARIASAAEFSVSPLCKDRRHPRDYDEHMLRKEYRGKRYVVVRADRVIFAACKNLAELRIALEAADRVLCGNVA